MFRFVVVVFLSEKTFAVSSSSSLRYRIPRPDLRTRLSFTRNQTRKFFRTTPVSQPTTMTTTTMTTTTKIQNTMIHHPHSRRRRRRQHSSCWLQSLLLSTTFLFLLLLTRCYGQPSPVPYLTVENYDELTRSKTVFIKFFAPWCAYSKRMEKTWDKLWKVWKDSDVGLVAQVDCTDTGRDGGKALCKKFRIESFPTLKYGDPNDLEEYDGERTFEDLSSFAEENLVPICSSDRLDLCTDEEQKRMIQNYMVLDETKLQQLIKDEEIKLEEAEKTFEAKIEHLSKEFETAQRIRDEAIEAVMNGDLGLMKSVQKAKEYQNKNSKNNNNQSQQEETQSDQEESEGNDDEATKEEL